MFKSKCRLSQHCLGQRGSVMTEAVIVLPVLFLVLAGVIQFAMIFAAQVNVRNASAVGAREGVLQGATDDDIIISTKSALVSPLDSDLLDVDVDVITVDDFAYIEVQVSYPLPLWFAGLIPGLGSSVNVNAATRMR